MDKKQCNESGSLFLAINFTFSSNIKTDWIKIQVENLYNFKLSILIITFQTSNGM